MPPGFSILPGELPLMFFNARMVNPDTMAVINTIWRQLSLTRMLVWFPTKRDTAAKWVRMFRRFVIRVWINYEYSTSIPKFTPVTTIFFLLNKICDGGSSKEPVLKAATLSILIWAYPRGTKTNNGNFKNAAILRSKNAYRWRACALILPLCHKKGIFLKQGQPTWTFKQKSSQVKRTPRLY